MRFEKSNVNNWLRGTIPALVTPFRNGEIDEAALEVLIERAIAAGVDCVVPAGTTGEGSTLSIEEHKAVVALTVKVVKGRLPVIAGVGSNDTAATIDLAEAAAQAGANALLAATGYYNRPPQAGLVAHYRGLADATDLPIVLYNVPGRTASDISVETMALLAQHPNVIGVKDATANLARVARQRLACGEDFIQLSGEDVTAVGFNAMGGRGCISVTTNVVPELCVALQAACREGRYDDALALQDKLTPLHDALFTDTSPAPVKYALSRLGFIREEVRLPLVPASDAAKAAVERALEALGLPDA